MDTLSYGNYTTEVRRITATLLRWTAFAVVVAMLTLSAYSQKFKFIASLSQTQDHVHEEADHDEFNDPSTDTTATHSHEHQHSPNDPPHSHQHQHGPEVGHSDSKIAFVPSVHNYIPVIIRVRIPNRNQALWSQGYLRGIFRPPIA